MRTTDHPPVTRRSSSALVVAIAVAASILGLIGLQILISATPVDLPQVSGMAMPETAYKLTPLGPFSAKLTLYGDRNLRVRRLYLVPVAEATHIAPLHDWAPMVSPLPKVETLILRLKVDPGTYKVVFEGVDPFGLLSVGRR